MTVDSFETKYEVPSSMCTGVGGKVVQRTTGEDEKAHAWSESQHMLPSR